MKKYNKFNMFIFGSTSEVMQALFRRHKSWFIEHIDNLYLVQRSSVVPKVYGDFKITVFSKVDCSDPRRFRKNLDEIVKRHATRKVPMHVFSTYGKFNWNFEDKVFDHTDDGLQINLNSRIQIIEAFRPYADSMRFHLLGSLFANFPYTGDYAISMRFVNQLVKNPHYLNLNLGLYNLGGMKTRFWDWQRDPSTKPFVFDDIKLPIDFIFKHGFIENTCGAVTLYPTPISRFACFLGRIGIRVL